MIYIRTDANTEIASGHVMRCLSIAEQLKKMGEDVLFITADEYPSQMIREKGFDSLVLNSDWKDMESELDRLLPYLKVHAVKKILVDSYQVTENYFKELGKYIDIIYLDDVVAFHYDVNAIINYSISAEQSGYEKEYSNTNARLFLGCAYIPLRKEFQKIKKKNIKKEISNVMLTTGGSDAWCLSEAILNKLVEKHAFVQFHVIVGRFFEKKDSLYKFAEQHANIHLYENVQRMSEIMRNCDLAVSAGGTTLYELCSCGVPTICLTLADNQIAGVKELEKQGIMLYAGDVRDSKKQLIEKIGKCFEQMQSAKIRQQMSNRMQKLVDGKGAKRIAEKMIQMK